MDGHEIADPDHFQIVESEGGIDGRPFPNRMEAGKKQKGVSLRSQSIKGLEEHLHGVPAAEPRRQEIKRRLHRIKSEELIEKREHPIKTGVFEVDQNRRLLRGKERIFDSRTSALGAHDLPRFDKRANQRLARRLNSPMESGASPGARASPGTRWLPI
jgi:hypothetical protein